MGDLNETPVRVLLIEDDEDDYVLTRDLLRDVDSRGFVLEWVADYGSARDAISRREHDVYLLDYRLGERDGIELLSEVKSQPIGAPVILLTGLGNREIDIKAMRAGADSYLAKGDLDGPLLDRTIRYAIHLKTVEEQLRARTRQQEAVVELGHWALSDPDLGNLFRRTVDTAARILCLDHAVVFEIAPGGATLIPRELLGIDEVPPGEDLASQPASLSAFTLLEGVPVLSDDLAGETRFYSPIGRRLNAQSAASVIIRGRDAPFGTLAVYARGRRRFSSDEVTFLQAVAAVLGSAVERHQAEAAQRAEAEVATALALAGGELLLGLASPQMLERLCRLCERLLACDGAAVLARDPERTGFACIERWSSNGPGEASEAEVELRGAVLGGPLAGFATGDVVEIDGDRRGPGLVGSGRRALCLALRTVREVTGVLIVSRPRERGEFCPVERRVADGLAKLATVALEHARLVRELESANRIKSDFVATISHELRTPLHVVIGYTELLLEGELGELQPEQRDALARVDRQTRSLAELVTQTLDLSRLERQELPVERRDVRLAGVLGDLADETRELQQKPGVSVVWSIAPDLPLLKTDAAKLKVVLRNVLGNAIKFTDQGTIEIDARRAGDGVEIAIRDTGIGIPPEMLTVIFEPFRQLESSFTRRYGGAGLGLYVSRRFLEALGGRIDAISEPGVGSTFRIWLPAPS